MKSNYALLPAAGIILCSLLACNSMAQRQSSIIRVDQPAINTQFDEASLREKMKADGLSEAVINTLIEQRKKLFLRGKNIDWKKISGKKTPVTDAMCTDIGAENSWGAWAGDVGTAVTGHVPTWTPPAALPAAPNFSITSGSAIDANTPGPNPGDPVIPVLCPNFGDSSIELGEMCISGCVAEQLTYAFTVTPNDTNFTFSYAIVLEDAGHAWADQPYFEIILLDTMGDTIFGSYYIYVGGPNLPGFYGVSRSGCGWQGTDQYKPWTMRGLHLASYIGQMLTVVVINCDCSQCGHFAYSYVDFDCDGILGQRFCPGFPTSINARSEPGSVYLWENGDTTATTNISSPAAGDTISCTISPWAGYTFKVSYILEPEQASFTYAAFGDSVLFTNTSGGSNCSWDFGDGNISSVCNPVHNYAANGTYTVCLTSSAASGCSNLTTCQVITITSSGINELGLINNILLMPNPASNAVEIETNNIPAQEKLEARIYNVIGTEVKYDELRSVNGKYMLNVSLLPEGVFFVKVSINKNEVTKKLIISRE